MCKPSGNPVQLAIIFVHILRFASTTPTWHTAGDGHKYLIEDRKAYNWLQALDQCARRNLQLANIDNRSKNDALVALLKSSFEKTPDLWLRDHDEFNSKLDTERSFYSASTGFHIAFGYWNDGEPNNARRNEHCTPVDSKADFKWIDGICDTTFTGYICEEHHVTAECRESVAEKRQTANQKNVKVADDFTERQTEIMAIDESTRQAIDNVLVKWQNSLSGIIEDSEKQQALVSVTTDAVKSIQDIYLNAEITTKNANMDFAAKLLNNKNEIDVLLAY